jgi:hypothetical protein
MTLPSNLMDSEGPNLAAPSQIDPKHRDLLMNRNDYTLISINPGALDQFQGGGFQGINTPSIGFIGIPGIPLYRVYQ